MAKTLLLVWSTPASPEVEPEFNRWYSETHIPELRAAELPAEQNALGDVADTHGARLGHGLSAAR